MDSNPDNEDDNADEATFWGETHIGEVIDEANELHRDPEALIMDRKAGVPATPEQEFKTIYRKESEPGFFRRFLNRFRSE